MSFIITPVVFVPTAGHSDSTEKMDKSRKILFMISAIVFLASLTEAAPSHSSVWKRQYGRMCTNFDLRDCDITSRVDRSDEDLCRAKSETIDCMHFVAERDKCMLVSDLSTYGVINTLDSLACPWNDGCSLGLAEYKAGDSKTGYYDEEELCRDLRRAVELLNYFRENCDTSLPQYNFISDGYVNSLTKFTESACRDLTTDTPTGTSTTTPFVIPTQTTPEIVTENPTTPPPPQTYHCFELFTCPRTQASDLVPDGNMTVGYTFTEEYFGRICTYLEELFMCNQNADFTECRFLESVMNGYAQYYYTLCFNDSQSRADLISLLPCMNEHTLQINIFMAYMKMSGAMETIFTWPFYYGLKKATESMYCRAYHSFLNDAEMHTMSACGVGHSRTARTVLEALGALGEELIGKGCKEPLPDTTIITYPFDFDD